MALADDRRPRPTAAALRAPACPITGRPAVRRIQKISRTFLTHLWRHSHRTEVGHLYADVPEIELWESPAGLAFFHPMIAGDASFYEAFYRTIAAHETMYDAKRQRGEFIAGARFVRPGDKVLDVGCGSASFQAHVPAADYLGLDPYVDEAHRKPFVRAESIDTHAVENPELYDVVSAFQVIEHVADPLTLARRMVAALKPGGTFLLAAPAWPSPMTEIPNLVFNGPPHHLSWWNERALRALADVLGVEVLEVSLLPANRVQSPIHWIHRFSVVRGRRRHFTNRWPWHASLAVAWAFGYPLGKLLPPPPGSRPIDIFLAARKSKAAAGTA